MVQHSPKTEAELSDIIQSAARTKTPLAIKGGGTRPIGHPVSSSDTITTKNITGISLYEPGALTIVANAGTPLELINKELAKENQHLPFEPADYAGLFGLKGKSTIGGVVAAAVSGPRRIQAGACRDSLIGIRFVSGEGTIIKNGGRVMKNVTGYDLVKLFAGSYGTLGVMTEVSFKVLPKPELTGVIRVHGLEDEDAVAVLAKALSSPFDVSGAAHLPAAGLEKAETLVRIEGFEKSIKYRADQLKELLAPHLPENAELSIDLDPKKTIASWKNVRDLKGFHNNSGEIWRLSVKPSDSPKIVSELKRAMELEAIYDWGGGLVWLALTNADAISAEKIRNVVNQHGGHGTLIKPAAGKVHTADAFHPEPARIADLSRNLRKQFDPAGILNPGLMARDLVGA